MNSKWLVGLVAVLLVFSFASPASAHGDKRPVKMGILLVAFGSSMPEAQVSFTNIDASVKAAFPDVPVRWAYTSHIIRKKLAREGKRLDSPEVALAKMMDEGFTHVAVQSLHTIGGEEYHHLRRNVHQFAGMAEGIKRILVGNPMLSTEADMERAAKAVSAMVPKDRKPTDAVVLMGHGTPHPSNAFYAALMWRLQQTDPNMFVGTVEGSPEINEISALLKKNNIKKAYLIPFMSVAGDHARNDMAGDEPDSWKSILTKQGITCVPVLKGTAEVDAFVDIWVDHLRGAFGHFKH